MSGASEHLDGRKTLEDACDQAATLGEGAWPPATQGPRPWVTGTNR